MDETSSAADGITRLDASRGRSPEVAEETDKHLLASVAQGDERAFAELYQRHAPALYNFLLRLIHEPPVAEDLLQESYVALWQGAGAFKQQSKVKTWLFRIAHNKAISWLRRNHPQSLEEDHVTADDSAGPEALSIISWRNEELLKALEQLSPKHRAVVELAFVHDLAYSEIALVMECPVGTVKSRMSYALRHLYRLLIDSELRD